MFSYIKPQRGLCFTYIGLMFLLLVFHSNVSAGVTISPTYLIVSAPSRSGAITVTNTTDKDREVWIEFHYGYQSIDKDGKPRVVITIADSGGEHSAARWLRAYPERFLLTQNASQVIRIRVSPPPGVSDGEYWARIVVGSKEAHPSEAKKSQVQFSPLRATVGIIELKDIPFHFRQGRTSARLSIRGVSTTMLKDTMKLSINLQQLGNAAYWGTASIRLKDRSGTTVGSLKRGVVIYQDEVAIFLVPVSGPVAGEYSLEVKITTGGQGIRIQDVLHVDPTEYSTNITLP